MRWLKSEYILKGVYLGLLLFTALDTTRNWHVIAGVALSTLGGLAVALAVSAYGKLRQGYQVKGRLPAFILFLLLESPALVYAGIIVGTAAGAFTLVSINQDEQDRTWQYLLACVASGAALGIVFSLLRGLPDRRIRLGLSLGLAALLVLGALYRFKQFEEAGPLDDPFFAAQLLLSIPFFYVLTFAGKEEESEIEIGAMCAALGVGLWLLTHHQSKFSLAGFIVPMLLYFFYTIRVLPGLRVLKHALRGLSYAKVGRHRQALQSFRLVLEQDPNNKLAREGLWSIHRSLDLATLANDPEMLATIDLDLCLERASALLLEPRPGPQKLEEAQRLLDLVHSQRPAMQPRIAYWRAVAFTHAGQYDRAAAELESILDSSQPADQAQRLATLMPAWQLALVLHDELRRRVGLPQLAVPGRRMEAIAALERHLADNPDDPSVWELKRLLYQDLTETDYDAAVALAGAAGWYPSSYQPAGQQGGGRPRSGGGLFRSCLRSAARPGPY